MQQRDPNHPGADAPPPPEPAVERALQAAPDPRQQGVGAPMAAMAEALRANAEALRVLDHNQRKMAESMEKSDKSTQVVASTRALNETFRGLSEIQKGLLDAVVKNRGGGGGGAFLVLAFLLLAALTGVGGVLLFDKLTGGEKVSKALYEEARRSADGQAAQIASLQERIKTGEEKAREQEKRLDEKDRSVADLERTKGDLEKRLETMAGELETNKAQLANFLQVKQQADLSGQLQVRNLQLEQDNRRLRERVKELEGKNELLMGKFGDMMLDMRGGDKEAIMDMAKKMGVFKEPETGPEAEGTVRLSRRGERLVKEQLNRLLPDVDDSYMLLSVKGIDEGTVLRDVRLGGYERGTMVKSLTCKELTIRVDRARDTVELRLKDGYIVNNRRPREKIPFSEDGHSIFLRDVGLQNWLRRVGAYITVGDDGMLTWKTTPS